MNKKEALKEISDRVSKMNDLMNECVKLSEDNDVPFSWGMAQMSNTYMPESYIKERDKAEEEATAKGEDFDEGEWSFDRYGEEFYSDYGYDGWQTSSC